MNEEKFLYSYDLKGGRFGRKNYVEDISSSEEKLIITLKGGDTFTFWYYHDQDCCENVYADFSVMGYYKKQILDDYYGLRSLKISGVEGLGFIIHFVYGDENSQKVLISCHNEQNGYYGTNLYLHIKHNDEPEVVVDISDYEQDLIN